MSYCKSDNNKNNKCKGRTSTTPMQQSYSHAVVCRMWWWPYCTTWPPAAQAYRGWVRRVHQRRCASTPMTACMMPTASTARMPRRPHPSRRATTSLLPKKVTTNPLPRMATGLGAMMSLSPQGQLAVYAVQGNDNTLTTIGDWATTFDNREGTKALTIKLISPIMIPYHRNEAP